jgi:hypothetical protein
MFYIAKGKLFYYRHNTIKVTPDEISSDITVLWLNRGLGFEKTRRAFSQLRDRFGGVGF